ncbi:hypothetical protein PVAR5_8931 [Paecilomyces variotii No. 5]|uniref:Uncharacterized protein n=1 Tax=Byssochlamys spectabilis (strain No. 5 / NBRC 109023) TaxID=1356009 RepID=V5G6T6_BYSSN|nr:hypothetical protein PVAR5_8931 [Paecilomyces variotii No. 5]
MPGRYLGTDYTIPDTSKFIPEGKRDAKHHPERIRHFAYSRDCPGTQGEVERCPRGANLDSPTSQIYCSHGEQPEPPGGTPPQTLPRPKLRRPQLPRTPRPLQDPDPAHPPKGAGAANRRLAAEDEEPRPRTSVP